MRWRDATSANGAADKTPGGSSCVFECDQLFFELRIAWFKRGVEDTIEKLFWQGRGSEGVSYAGRIGEARVGVCERVAGLRVCQTLSIDERRDVRWVGLTAKCRVEHDKNEARLSDCAMRDVQQ